MLTVVEVLLDLEEDVIDALQAVRRAQVPVVRARDGRPVCGGGVVGVAGRVV